jgi:phosphoribosyl 1,2-cyclic phosphate phosphodiesterase
MKIKSTFCFLGTGGSMGIPVIGCSCAVCTSPVPFNKRFRPSALCKIGSRNFLIDCGPDFREQALRHHITHLDGVLFTHAHNDHTAGVDDLRVFCLRSHKSMPCLLSSEASEELRKRFFYLFDSKSVFFPLTTHLLFQTIDQPAGEVSFEGVRVEYFSYKQAGACVNGFRLGNLAYVTDIKEYSDTIFEQLKGIDTLVISALRFQPSPMHLNVDEAIAFARKVNPKKTWFMHAAHELDHEKTNAYLPLDIRLAYDGLEIEFEVDVDN